MNARLASLGLVLLLTSGCAHQAATRDTPPAQVVADAAPTADPIVDPAAPADAVATATEAAPVVAGTEPASADATTDAAAGQAPTEAEQDFAAIYGETALGQAGYDPIADPTLPTPVVAPQSYDPWEKYNRQMHRFNNAVDRSIAKPLARAYVKVVPRPMRLGVSNFFNNLGQPVSALNALLQGKPKQAGQSLGRFLMNSTLGLAGLFDPATSAKIPNRSEDFGQTLGKWGWKRSRYVELPLFGPRTVRDTFGMLGDAPLSPTRRIGNDATRVGLQGLQLVDLRTQLMATDSLREGATDDYALVRDAWLQRRQYQIHGDQQNGNSAELPDYLRDMEDDPTVPVNAMPGLPGTP
ncbi:MlaA family lipoprotein [Lysobacter brunescens]|uniref:VacJ family lipoprotein n=1 Tax=Lysobacter brunescens TaxID=262323 RepID=A0ABW2YBB7_9GAMM